MSGRIFCGLCQFDHIFSFAENVFPFRCGRSDYWRTDRSASGGPTGGKNSNKDHVYLGWIRGYRDQHPDFNQKHFQFTLMANNFNLIDPWHSFLVY